MNWSHPSGFLHRQRAEALMEGASIDALLIADPENFRYVTGAPAGFPASWRRAGTQFVVVPAAATAALGVVIPDALERSFRSASAITDVRTHPVWTDHVEFESQPTASESFERAVGAAIMRTGPVPLTRPGTYDIHASLAELRALLRDRNLLRARIGVEFDFIPLADFQSLTDAIPEAAFADGSSVVRHLRLIKQPEEIHRLRLGARLAESGMQKVLREVRPGVTTRELSLIYRRAVIDEALARGYLLEAEWSAFCCGPDVAVRGSSSEKVAAGHAIKLDCSCRVSGYVSDIARTFILSPGSPHQRSMYAAVLEAWTAGLEGFRPGQPINQVHATAQSAMRKAGYATYTRGHVGHSIGSTIWNEEWPFISADEAMVFEPNMVFAYEVPVYATGLGSFSIEDHIIVTETGPESMNSMPRDYCELGAGER